MISPVTFGQFVFNDNDFDTPNVAKLLVSLGETIHYDQTVIDSSDKPTITLKTNAVNDTTQSLPIYENFNYGSTTGDLIAVSNDI